MTAPRSDAESGEVSASALDTAAALGEAVLAQILTYTPDAILVANGNRDCLYANPVACQWLGRSFTELRQHGLPPSVASTELHGPTTRAGRWTGPDGAVREIVHTTSAVNIGTESYTMTAARDLAEPRTAVREAIALAQTVAQVAGTSSINQVLADIARHAVEGTRATMAGISILGEDDRLGVGGAFGPGGPSFTASSPAWTALNRSPGATVIEAMTAGGFTVGHSPGRAVVLADARSLWAANPVMAEFAEALSGLEWKGAVCVPLAWRNQVIGVFGAYLPAGVAGPTEGELAFLTTLADQAAIAVSTAQLDAKARRAAALEERGRLARELHDSVSQALFSMTMHARAAELSLTRTDVDPTSPVTRSVRQLAALARELSAEMRALIFELRPEPVTAADTPSIDLDRRAGALDDG